MPWYTVSKRRDAAEDEALEERVHGGGDVGVPRHEDRREADDEAAQETDHHQEEDEGWVPEREHDVPDDDRSDQDEEEEEERLGGGALNRHRARVHRERLAGEPLPPTPEHGVRRAHGLSRFRGGGVLS